MILWSFCPFSYLLAGLCRFGDTFTKRTDEITFHCKSNYFSLIFCLIMSQTNNINNCTFYSVGDYKYQVFFSLYCRFPLSFSNYITCFSGFLGIKFYSVSGQHFLYLSSDSSLMKLFWCNGKGCNYVTSCAIWNKIYHHLEHLNCPNLK